MESHNEKTYCSRCGAAIDNEARIKEQQEHPETYFPRLSVDKFIYVTKPPYAEGALEVLCGQLCDDCQEQLENWFSGKDGTFVDSTMQPGLLPA